MTSRNLSRSRTLHWNYSHLNNFVASKFIFLFLLFLFFLFFYFVLFVVEWTQKWSTMAWKRKRIIALNSLSNSNKNNEIRVFFAFLLFCVRSFPSFCPAKRRLLQSLAFFFCSGSFFVVQLLDDCVPTLKRMTLASIPVSSFGAFVSST